MIALIIISKNQVKYLPQMLLKLKAMSEQADKIYYLTDRDSAADCKCAKKLIEESGLENLTYIQNETIPGYLGRPIMYYGEEHFLSGYCRNFCIDKAIADGCDQFVFIDGDCLPEGDIISGYKKYLTCDEARLICGKRDESHFHYRDQREFNEYDNIFSEHLTPVTSETAMLDSAVVWSCNIGMNLSAINRLRTINDTLYGKPEVFSSFFLGTWGGEDGFLGAECFYDSDIKIYGLGVGRTGITHIHHDRPLKKYGFNTFTYRLKTTIDMHRYLLENYTI